MSSSTARDATDAPASLGQIAAAVESRLRVRFDDERTRWAALTPDLVPPIDALWDLVAAGGKRLRPAFCHWGFVAAGGDPDDDRTVEAGAAFELLQAFALIHDDIMDDSATRRGQPATHLRFVADHDDRQLRGEARRFGEGVAILVGDLAHAYADRAARLATAPLSPGDASVAMSVWDELRIELNVGQYLDLLGTARADTDLAGARRIARYKSGKYTIERPLHLGAALAGRLGEHQAALSAYGDPLGEAFQLRDDILGAFGDAIRLGKPVGGDLREGKPTPLLAIAHERASDAQRAVLDTVGHRDLDDAGVAAIGDVLAATGARDAIESDIDRLTAAAVGALDDADFDPAAVDELRALAYFVAGRAT